MTMDACVALTVWAEVVLSSSGISHQGRWGWFLARCVVTLGNGAVWGVLKVGWNDLLLLHCTNVQVLVTLGLLSHVPCFRQEVFLLFGLERGWILSNSLWLSVWGATFQQCNLGADVSLKRYWVQHFTWLNASEQFQVCKDLPSCNGDSHIYL